MFGRCSAAFARFIVCAAAAGAARREGPLWIVTGRPEGERASERARSALTYLLVTTIYDGDRIDHGQLERRASAREITCRDDGLGRRTRTAVHRNIDVILPRSHSCSKKAPRRAAPTPIDATVCVAGVAPKKEEMPTEDSCARGDNLANRRDDKFRDQRGRESFKGGEQRSDERIS